MSQPPSSPLPPSNPHRAPDDKEEVYYEGAPSLKGEAGTLILCVIAAVFVFGIGVAIPVAWGGTYWYAVPVGLFLGGLVLAYPVITTRFRRYKITNYRIDFERGLLSKTIDTLELWHVEDINFHQSLWDRMLGVGTLTVISHDDTTPSLQMKGLPEPRRLFDLLKQRVISVKRSRGVLKLDT